MSKVIVTKDLLDDLADAVASKSNASIPMTVSEMTDAVESTTFPSGSKNITSNGTVDVYDYETVVVNVQPTLETRTVTYTPTRTQQTETIGVTQYGVYGLESVEVIVNPIPPEYGLVTWDGSVLTIS